jgi:putative acetyltransferase
MFDINWENMIIRKEEIRDLEEITQVTIAAFENHPISRQTEHFIINSLRSQRPLPSHQRLI